MYYVQTETDADSNFYLIKSQILEILLVIFVQCLKVIQHKKLEYI